MSAEAAQASDQGDPRPSRARERSEGLRQSECAAGGDALADRPRNDLELEALVGGRRLERHVELKAVARDDSGRKDFARLALQLGRVA